MTEEELRNVTEELRHLRHEVEVLRTRGNGFDPSGVAREFPAPQATPQEQIDGLKAEIDEAVDDARSRATLKTYVRPVLDVLNAFTRPDDDTLPEVYEPDAKQPMSERLQPEVIDVEKLEWNAKKDTTRQ